MSSANLAVVVATETSPVVVKQVDKAPANDKPANPWGAAPGQRAGSYVPLVFVGVGQPDENDDDDSTVKGGA